MQVIVDFFKEIFQSDGDCLVFGIFAGVSGINILLSREITEKKPVQSPVYGWL
jgi:hypothetical protein